MTSGRCGRERDRIVPVLLVLRQRGVVAQVKLGVQRLGQLARAVGAEVEEHAGVAVAHGALVADQRGLHELVGLAALVRVLDGLGRGVGVAVLGLAADDGVHGLGDPLLPLVAVHGEVAAGHVGDPPAGGLEPALDGLQVTRAGLGRGVAAVGEGVHHHVGNALVGSQLDQRLQVIHRRVHAALGDQTQQVEAARVARRGAGVAQHLVLGEGAVLDRVVDALEVLGHDLAGAQVQVAHLRVAHLALGQAHGGAPRGQLGVRVLLPQLVEHRRVGQLDGVARPGLGQPPAVQDDQGDGRVGHPAAATMAAKSSGSRLAPPTSAPSTSGWDRISAALPGLTDPP